MYSIKNIQQIKYFHWFCYKITFNILLYYWYYFWMQFTMTERYFTHQEHSESSKGSCSFLSEEDKEPVHLGLYRNIKYVC